MLGRTRDDPNDNMDNPDVITDDIQDDPTGGKMVSMRSLIDVDSELFCGLDHHY